MRLRNVKKLLSPAGISKNTHRKWFPIVEERLFYQKWLHLNLNNGFTSSKFVLNKGTLDRTSVSTHWNKAFNKNPFPLAGNTASIATN